MKKIIKTFLYGAYELDRYLQDVSISSIEIIWIDRNTKEVILIIE